MSKTVDDLVDEFLKHWLAHGRMEDDIREGVKAIVRALRDEVLQSTFLEDEGMVTVVDDIFDEILGDAGEKVAGSSAREGEAAGELRTPSARSPATDPAPPPLPTRTVQLTGITKSARPDVQFEPVTDPAGAERSDATAVCEWTREHNLPGSGWFDCEGNRHWIKSECPCCNLPIKFTEAK